MAVQRETLMVCNPMDICLQSHGWYLINTHGNQFQAGLPDRYICHPKYSPRWVEYKVFTDGYGVHLTDAQKKRFPIMHGYGVPIFVIASKDLRGASKFSDRERLYKKLFQEPNVMYALNKMTHKFLR